MSNQKTLLTPADFSAWQKMNAASIRGREAENQRAVDDAVIRWVMPAIQSGMGLAEAGDIAVRGFSYGTRNGIYFNKAAVRRALKSIGWQLKRDRAGDAEE
ncbi:MAG TPA: hypothetical protein VGN52_01025 [Burkholderiales bacterium]|jgi:hypothetical protein